MKFDVISSAGVKLRVRTASTHDTAGTVAVDAPTAAIFASYVVLPAGSYTVDVTETGAAGPYTITPTAVVPPNPTGCISSSSLGHMSAVVGITVDGAISTNDCLGTSSNVDSYDLYATGGQLRTITVTASIGMNIEVHTDPGPLVTFKNLNTAGTNTLTFTPSATARYHISLIAVQSGVTGTYTLKIQ